MRRTILGFVGVILALALTAAAAEAKRLALVIGNGAYRSIATLANPVPDARAIARALKENGFEVVEHYDLARADFLDALEDFRTKAAGADLALVFYAGHGMELAGKNVLAPVDIDVDCDSREARRSVPIERLFEATAPARNQVILLDSCRNDPFPQCPTRSARSGSGFRGLSRIASGEGSTIIANATLAGELAADGQPGEHSPFAGALLKRMSTSPSLYLRDLLDQVAEDVRLATNFTQVPEITARGGSPKLCLSLTGCGTGLVPPDGAALLAQAGMLLGDLGLLASRSAQPEEIRTAIRAFQEKAGMPVDGEATATLIAVLTAMKFKGGEGKTPDLTGKPLAHAVGESFRDCEDCPEMAVVPAGRFTFGSPLDEAGRQREEGPTVEVTIARPFAVSKLEITFDEWETCVLEGGCGNYRPKDAGWGRGRRPVINVSYEDAVAYVAWLRAKTGEPYRLLTEAEWEYAARAGTTTAFATGRTLSTAEANFDGTGQGRSGSDAYRGKSVEVGSFPPNPFGLYDLHGNLAEWTEDCWNPGHQGAPQDGSARGGDCTRRVVKGGAWYFELSYARAAARMSYPANKRLNVVGFRVARDL
jgi:formylglycine-generating enzyme required for sulfatase activity